MKKLLTTLLIGLLGFSAMAAPKKAADVTVGIIAPVSIPAMTEISNGFRSELTTLYPGHIHFLVSNAQGDLNIQRSILQQFKAKNVNLVVPIGTSVAQMAVSLNRSQPIVALAAEFTTKQRNKFRNTNVTNILDQIDIGKQMAFIHAAFPKLKKISLVYSADDRIFSEVKQATAAGKKYGITIQKLMVQGLPQLYTVSKQIDIDSKAIFILKDELIVSGINTLVKQAAQKHMLLIASDDGSVQKGADFAVGVSEHLIGVGGAKLATQVLAGTSPSQIPVKIMKKYHVYVTPGYENTDSLGPDYSFAKVKKAAAKFNYPVETLALAKN